MKRICSFGGLLAATVIFSACGGGNPASPTTAPPPLVQGPPAQNIVIVPGGEVQIVLGGSVVLTATGGSPSEYRTGCTGYMYIPATSKTSTSVAGCENWFRALPGPVQGNQRTFTYQWYGYPWKGTSGIPIQPDWVAFWVETTRSESNVVYLKLPR